MAPRNFEERVEKGGPVFEPVFRPHFLIPYKAKGQKTGPYSGLKCWTAFGAKSVLFCCFFIIILQISSRPRLELHCFGSVCIMFGQCIRQHCS